MARRRYSDRERAEALAMYDACGNLTEVSKTLGIPDSTISAWINHGAGLNDDIPDLRSFKKLDLASKLDTIAHQCAGLLPNRLPDANVREIVGAMSQSIEKSQLLKGNPTNITASVDNASILRSIEKIAASTNSSKRDVTLNLLEELSDPDDPSYSSELQDSVRDILETLPNEPSDTIPDNGLTC